MNEASARRAEEGDAMAEAAIDTNAEGRQRIQRHRVLVLFLRVALLVVALGGWEIAGRLKWIDPFFFAMPSQIADQTWTWIVEGTSQGPLWVQVLVTLEETVLGFLIGAVLGILCGVA